MPTLKNRSRVLVVNVDGSRTRAVVDCLQPFESREWVVVRNTEGVCVGFQRPAHRSKLLTRHGNEWDGLS